MPKKVHLVKAMGFPVIMYGCESWNHKESWAPKNWCFLTVALQKTCESSLDCKEIQPVNPKRSQPSVFIGRKLKLQYFCHLMWITDSLEKTLMLGKIEGWRRRGWQRWDGWMASLTQWTWVWVNFGSWWWTGKPGMLQSMGLKKVRHDWVTELNWISLSLFVLLLFPSETDPKYIAVTYVKVCLASVLF